MISFCKMQATGNDFVIINCLENSFKYDFSTLAEFLCNRKFGIGADGVIFLLEGKKQKFRMRIFNYDGSEAEMCGNGIRCLAKYIYEKGLCDKKTDSKKMCIETLAGEKEIELIVENKTVIGVKVDMGNPVFEYSKIPVIFPNVIEKKLQSTKIEIDKKVYEIFAVSMGNPHAVCFVENLEEIELEKIGPIIEKYKYFPNKTNVEFVQIMGKNRIKVLVWERGVRTNFELWNWSLRISSNFLLKEIHK